VASTSIKKIRQRKFKAISEKKNGLKGTGTLHFLAEHLSGSRLMK